MATPRQSLQDACSATVKKPSCRLGRFLLFEVRIITFSNGFRKTFVCTRFAARAKEQSALPSSHVFFGPACAEKKRDPCKGQGRGGALSHSDYFQGWPPTL